MYTVWCASKNILLFWKSFGNYILGRLNLTLGNVRSRLGSSASGQISAVLVAERRTSGGRGKEKEGRVALLGGVKSKRHFYYQDNQQRKVKVVRIDSFDVSGEAHRELVC